MHCTQCLKCLRRSPIWEMEWVWSITWFDSVRLTTCIIRLGLASTSNFFSNFQVLDALKLLVCLSSPLIRFVFLCFCVNVFVVAIFYSISLYSILLSCVLGVKFISLFYCLILFLSIYSLSLSITFCTLSSYGIILSPYILSVCSCLEV